MEDDVKVLLIEDDVAAAEMYRLRLVADIMAGKINVSWPMWSSSAPGRPGSARPATASRACSKPGPAVLSRPGEGDRGCT